MNGRTILVLMLAVLCGGSAVVAVSQLQPKVVEVEEETTPVVVAAIDIPRGTSLTADVLKLVDWPRDRVPSGAVAKVEEVVGRTVVIPMLQSEPVVEAKVAEGLGVASLLEPGMRAFTISTPTMGAKVAGLLLPGNKVDVLWTQSRRRDQFTGGASVSTLLQRVEVFATDQAVETKADNQGNAKLQSVTLAVTEEQAKRLSLAQSEGTLSLALRRDDDAEDNRSPIITLNDLRGVQGGPPVQEQLAAAASFLKSLIPEPSAAAAAAPEPAPEPVWVRIRTLRGRSASQVNLQLHGQAKVTPASEPPAPAASPAPAAPPSAPAAAPPSVPPVDAISLSP